MEMDKGQILREFNAASNKDKQITVLAELNLCQPLDIALALDEQGADLSDKWRERVRQHWAEQLPENPAPKKTRKPRTPKALPDVSRPEPQREHPETLTAGVLLQLLSRIPEATPIRVRGNGTAATMMAYTEAWDAATWETQYILEIG